MQQNNGGYNVKQYSGPVKRYCQTLDLKDNPELIAEYRRRHGEGEAWAEVIDGIKEVGILEMEIYLVDTRLFMIVLAKEKAKPKAASLSKNALTIGAAPK